MKSPDAQQILGYLQARRQEMMDFLERLVQSESPSTVPDAQRRVLGPLAGALGEMGFAVRHVRGRETGGHLYARPRGRRRGQPIQLLIGHCDTVWPLGTLDAMPVRHEHNVMQGPGVLDMKGGLTQMLFALETLGHFGDAPPVAPVVFVNSDEEIGSRESARYIRWLARIADRAFVMEPALGSSGGLKTARKGVGRFHVRVLGRSAHAGLEPEAGASAILELSHVIQALHALNDPERGITVNVGMIEGGLRPNVVAPESLAVVDVRVRTMEDARRVEGVIHGLQPVTEGTILEVEGRVGRPPMERTPRNHVLWLTARRLGQTLGLALEEAEAGGASDGNITSQYTATLDGLGAVGGGAHARHEFAYVDKMVERAALLALLLRMAPLSIPASSA